MRVFVLLGPGLKTVSVRQTQYMLTTIGHNDLTFEMDTHGTQMMNLKDFNLLYI